MGKVNAVMRAQPGGFSRTARTLAALGFLALGVLMLLAPAGAQTDESGAYANLSTAGWWERKPSVPNVPANAVAVAAQNGSDTKVAAFGVDMYLPEGEELVGLTLTLKESSTPGATFPPLTQQGQGQAPTQVLVVACPITSTWNAEDGGDKANAPVADCDLARGDGVRNADGTWTFDLTMLAELWSSETIEQNGLLLIERVAAPMSFQVSYDDLSTGTPKLELETLPALEEDSEDGEEFEEEFEEEVEGGTGSDTGGDSFFDAIGEDVTGTPDTPFGITDTPPTTAPPAEPVDEPREPVANRRPTKGSLPVATLALVPIAAGLALLSSVVLGPAGDPATARRRDGGLSRALARRSPTPQQ